MDSPLVSRKGSFTVSSWLLFPKNHSHHCISDGLALSYSPLYDEIAALNGQIIARLLSQIRNSVDSRDAVEGERADEGKRGDGQIIALIFK